MKIFQVITVTSITAHPNGLVERQIKTMLTILWVSTPRRIQGWDEHVNGVRGANNPTRQVTSSFAPYMLQLCAEISASLSSYTLNSQPEV